MNDQVLVNYIVNKLEHQVFKQVVNIVVIDKIINLKTVVQEVVVNVKQVSDEDEELEH